jgi:hypothetical protein
MDRPRYHLVCAAVQEFPWKLPFLRRLSPMWRGGVKSVTLILLAALPLGVSFIVDRPATTEAGTVAQIGAAFLIAYGVETTWVVRETNLRSSSYQTWLGLVTGLAVCGLSGIVISAGLATDSGTSVLCEIGFSWSCGSIFMLGAIVAVTPVLSYAWRHQLKTEFDDE